MQRASLLSQPVCACRTEIGLDCRIECEGIASVVVGALSPATVAAIDEAPSVFRVIQDRLRQAILRGGETPLVSQSPAQGTRSRCPQGAPASTGRPSAPPGWQSLLSAPVDCALVADGGSPCSVYHANIWWMTAAYAAPIVMSAESRGACGSVR